MPTETCTASRRILRLRLHAERDAFVARPGHGELETALAKHLAQALEQLSPDRLGVYRATRSEFNAAAACLANEGLRETPFALPFVLPVASAPMSHSESITASRDMEYRAWNRQPPTLLDACGIASIAGPMVVPDVVLAPCLGFTADGFRIGYGGGYFDRWLAAHPHVTAIGIAWSATQVDAAAFEPLGHDIPMMMVITEQGIVAG